MSFIDRAVAANRKRTGHDPALAQKPAPKIAILTCMDPRLNELLQWLGIKPADADVIRNVGTVANNDVVRSLMFSIHVLGVREGMIVGHTGCGMEMFSEEAFEEHIHKQCGVWAVSPSKFYCCSDVDFTTQKQVLKLRSPPWITSDVIIRAFVFDLATGGMKEVTPTRTNSCPIRRASIWARRWAASARWTKPISVVTVLCLQAHDHLAVGRVACRLRRVVRNQVLAQLGAEALSSMGSQPA
jgi:carbonic anhydrase